MPLLALVAAATLVAPQAQSEELGHLVLEMRGLRNQVALLELQLRKRDEGLEAMGRELRALATELGSVKDRSVPTSAPFLAGPPTSSDTVGVAKTVVFAPRLEVDSVRRRDLLFVKVRRIEAGDSRAVGSLEFTNDQTGVDLPVDQNGALYVVDWSTSEGHTYTLVLRDGATGQVATQVQVKPQQNQGRFLFVGYRLE